jgi:hypothetical protein
MVKDGERRDTMRHPLNTNPLDMPIHFYRRIGFTDEVHWRARYTFNPK